MGETQSHLKKKTIRSAIRQLGVYDQSSMTCKVNSKTFILTPFAQSAIPSPTDFAQPNGEAQRAETMSVYCCITLCNTVPVAEWTHNRCLLK